MTTTTTTTATPDIDITKPTRRTYLVAELKCYLCGAEAGSLEGEQRSAGEGSWARVRNVTFRRPGAEDGVNLLDWHGLRCGRCGGPLYMDETDVVTRRFEDYNWLEERPRRGRPPKRLVEERRRERELFDSQAA